MSITRGEPPGELDQAKKCARQVTHTFPWGLVSLSAIRVQSAGRSTTLPGSFFSESTRYTRLGRSRFWREDRCSCFCILARVIRSPRNTWRSIKLTSLVRAVRLATLPRGSYLFCDQAGRIVRWISDCAVNSLHIPHALQLWPISLLTEPQPIVPRPISRRCTVPILSIWSVATPQSLATLLYNTNCLAVAGPLLRRELNMCEAGYGAAYAVVVFCAVPGSASRR